MAVETKAQLAYLVGLPEWAAFKELAHQIRNDKIVQMLGVKTTEDNMHYQKMMTLKGEIAGITELLNKIDDIRKVGTNPNKIDSAAKVVPPVRKQQKAKVEDAEQLN